MATIKSSIKCLLPVSDGSEDMETVIVADVLRRAGFSVLVASVHATSLQVTLANKCVLLCDVLLADISRDQFDLIVLPGGMPGAERLRDCEPLIEALKRQADEDRWFAAICAAPAVVFEWAGLLEGRTATCYPAFQNKLTSKSQILEPVVVSKKCVTSQGPGTTMLFALTLVEMLGGFELAQLVATRMVFPYTAYAERSNVILPQSTL